MEEVQTPGGVAPVVGGILKDSRKNPVILGSLKDSRPLIDCFIRRKGSLVGLYA